MGGCGMNVIVWSEYGFSGEALRVSLYRFGPESLSVIAMLQAHFSIHKSL
jgi:hypothetical protein